MMAIDELSAAEDLTGVTTSVTDSGGDTGGGR